MQFIPYLIIIASISIWLGCSSSNSDTTRSKETKVTTKKIAPTPKVKDQNHFKIIDIDNRSTLVSFEDTMLKVARVTQPIVMLNIFAEWSPPSCGMIPYLDSLQKRYPKDLFVIGVVTNSDITNKNLRTFMKKYNASYFISNSRDNDKLAKRISSLLGLDENFPIPLTVLFKNGKYNRHYIGATPIEMLMVDIEQLISEGE